MLSKILPRIVALVAILILALGNVTISDDADPSSLFKGLVAYWSFDEGEGDIVFDETRNGNDGILHGSTWGEGKLGFALSFDGVDDYVEVPHATSLDMGTSDFTISGWFKSSFEGTGYLISNRLGGYGVYPSWTIRLHEGTLQATAKFDSSASGGGPYTASSYYSNLNDANWHHFAAVYQRAGEIKLYVGGTLVDKKDISSWSSVVFSKSGNLRIGVSASDYFNGLIDEVCIYNRALSEEEIEELFQRGQYGTQEPYDTAILSSSQ